MNKAGFGTTGRFVALTLALALTACASIPDTTGKPFAVAGFPPGLIEGYLTADAVPSSLVQVPPPPAAGSAALALDLDIAQRSFALRDTPRWDQAIIDADLDFPHAAGAFSCALDLAITPTVTPHLYLLLRKTLTDFARTTYSAKVHYHRTRPFVENGQPMCTPASAELLSHDGSYPSGHNAIGWGWALILAEISPEQTDALMVRARNYGESRNVCNVHWHSDVMQGRLVGAGTVARLHADPVFRSDLAAAQVEIAAARRQGNKPTRDCVSEAASLAVQPSLAQ